MTIMECSVKLSEAIKGTLMHIWKFHQMFGCILKQCPISQNVNGFRI